MDRSALRRRTVARERTPTDTPFMPDDEARQPTPDLFAVRNLPWLPAWAQIVLVAACFVASVVLTHAEYLAKGTSYGFPGPAFNSLVNPIYEELIFRGWILGRLARRGSKFGAIAVSSVLFGILHLRNVFWLDPRALLSMVLYTGLVLGPILGWVTLRCRSVWPAVILHYVNNLGYFLRHVP